jgi:hypothetical protein
LVHRVRGFSPGYLALCVPGTTVSLGILAEECGKGNLPHSMKAEKQRVRGAGARDKVGPSKMYL